MSPRLTKSSSIFWALTLASAAAYFANIGLHLDDAFVYLRVARNFATTGHAVFNDGDAFSITTSPGWLLIVTALAKLAPAFALPALCKATFIALLVGASAILHGLLRSKCPALATLAPLPVFFALSMPTLVGMETSLALFAGLGLVASFDRRDRWTPLWMALFYLARPEGAIFGSLVAIVLLVEAISRRRVVMTVQFYALAAALSVAMVLVWHLWFYLTYGTITPATASVKMLQAHAGWPTFAQGWSQHFKLIYDIGQPLGINVVRTTIATIGAAILFRRVWPVVAWSIVHFIAFTAIGVAYYHWYYYAIDFALALALLAGGATLITAAINRARVADRPFVQMAGTVATILVAIVLLPPARNSALAAVDQSHASAFVDGRYETYVRLADQIREASPGGSFTVLSHEVGIIGYRLPEAAIRDVVGLATPVTSGQDLWNWKKQVQAFEPDYILYPSPSGSGQQVYQRATGEMLRYDAFLAEGGYIVLRKLDPGECPSIADVRAHLRPGLGGGWVDEFGESPTGSALVRGWAADLNGKAPAQLVAVLKGEDVLGCAPTGRTRPDVATTLNAPALVASGFEVDLWPTRPADVTPSSVVAVARLGDGSYAQLYIP